MKKNFFTKALLLVTALLCCQTMSSCKKNSDNKSSNSSVVENIQNTTTADEAELGEYEISENGIKLYYSESGLDESVNAKGIILALEKYFTSYEKSDFTAYSECIHPLYAEYMNKYLQEDYNYGLDKSFETQCDNLKVNAGGDFKITRIKIEAPENDNHKEYLDSLGEIFKTDFYDQIKADSDAIHDVIFFVIADTGEKETLLISEYEIIFAEKDGKFYAFG